MQPRSGAAASPATAIPPVIGSPVGWALRDRRARHPLVPIVVVTIGAGQIDLALPLREKVMPFGRQGGKLGSSPAEIANAARLLGHEGGDLQQSRLSEGKAARRLDVARGSRLMRAFEIDLGCSISCLPCSNAGIIRAASRFFFYF